MPATKKQLAALKKAHAALKKKRAAMKKKKAPARKKPLARRKAKPIKRTTRYNYLYVAKGPEKTRYWFTGSDFSTDKKDAKPIGREAAMNAAQKYRRRKALNGFNFYYTGTLVKKPDAVRKKNPVPLSSHAKLKRASDLYQDFTGHSADEIYETKFDFPKVGLEVGECDGILYTTVRDGKTEHYIHKFKKNSRPTLAASYDGKKIALVGGRYTFTDRGIVDH